MATRTLYLTRHAEATEDESVLTEAGRRQARLLGRRLRGLPITTVHHGPLNRAAQTAGLIAAETGATTEVTAVAGDYVPYVPRADELPPECARRYLDFVAGFDLTVGEELACSALERFTGPVAEDRHDLVVTHNFLIGTLVSAALGAPPWRWLTLNHANAALTVIRYPPDRPPMLVVFNDMSHLPESLRWTGFPDEARCL